jgi:hypothetical protein
MTESVELVGILRRLVAEVIVHAKPNGRGFTLKVKGRLSELAGNAAFPPVPEGGERW